MDTKIFLQGFRSKTSSNTSDGINVQLEGKRKLLPLNDVSKVISQYDQYKEEREKCNIIRLTCQVNPICSNILFNRITEIVKDEGSSGVTLINYGVGNDNLFNGVTFKQKTMDFWSGSTANYYCYLTDGSDSFNPKGLKIENLVHPTNAIRDTQLSNNDSGFKYHCGLDIFNNHLIRSNTFKTVCKYNGSETNGLIESDSFNTIADLMRDVNGNNVVENVYFPIDSNIDTKTTSLHLYKYDDIDTFEEAVEKKLHIKHNGWVGFNNRSKIKSYKDFANSDEMEIERPLMYMNGGDFVDMYPTRDLYSFVPKYNKERKRIEKNWNYCITYPSSSYTPTKLGDPFDEIIEFRNGINSLKTVYFDENTRSDNGTTQLVMYSVSKHGLSKGDYVNIYKTYETNKYWVVDTSGITVSDKFNTEEEADAELDRLLSGGTSDCGEPLGFTPSGVTYASGQTYTEKVLDNAEVLEVVDDYIFTVFNGDTKISTQWIQLSKEQLESSGFTIDDRTFTVDKTKKFIFEDDNGNGKLDFSEENKEDVYYIINSSYVNIDKTAQDISFKKVVGDIECDYYIRIFSKLPNFKYASADTSSEYAIYKDDAKMIHEYQDIKYDFDSQVSRLAFAKNIYTDDIGEIVFTDDIDISNLHDNLGRPLTSLYLTIIKNNKGYKEWYGYDYKNSNDWDVSDIREDNVEFSHAFGRVTCGIETAYEANFGALINCINRITNVPSNNGTENAPIGFIVDGVLNDMNNEVDEFRSYVNSREKEIRIESNEIWYDTDKNFYGDLCYYDGYNDVETHISYIMHRFNTAQRECGSVGKGYFKNFGIDEIAFDDYDSRDFEISSSTNSYECNNNGEGYYYNPHYEIPIKTFDKLQTLEPDFLTIREMNKIENGKYKFVTLEKHYLTVGDKAMLYDKVQDKYYNLETVSGESDNYKVFTCNVYDEKTNKLCDITFLGKWDSAETIDYMSSKVGSGMTTTYDFNLFKMDNIECPSYAKVLKDGTCRIIWRDVLNNGFNKTETSVEEYPFTNGAFYVNKKIDLYVRRQDPYGYYWLYQDNDIPGSDIDIFAEDNYVKEGDIEC